MNSQNIIQPKTFEKVYEWCPYCQYEVELEAKLKKQVCPICKKVIFPCAMCLPDEVDCINCPI